MGKVKRGRRRGGRAKGYYYRKARGWYAVDGKRSIPLCFINGEPIREKDTNSAELKQAYQRFQIAQANIQAAQTVQAAGANPDITLVEVCDTYLAHIAATGAKSTYYHRANALFDLCFALPGGLRRKDSEAAPYTPEELKQFKDQRCKHPAFGDLPAVRLTPLHIDTWLNAHPTWQNGRRPYIQAIKRALNYAVERRLIPENPIASYKVGKSRGRITYFTPEQEAALLKHAKPGLKMAIQVCIRTGLRYGIEFTRLSADRIVDMGNRMEWRVTPKKTKKSEKYRLVMVADPSLIELTREQMRQYPQGPIFRNERGNPWIPDNLTVAFTRLRRRVEKAEGIQFDPDACMNTCRHTFAKRTLQGYWSGKPTTTETLARLMGNTPQVCWNHYVQWCEAYNESLWDAVKGSTMPDQIHACG